MPERWTEQQKMAIEHFGHNILVSAGAGSGKTAVLSERVYTNVGKRKIDIDRMLVLTFTNKAAAEMKSRILKKIKEDAKGYFTLEEKKRQSGKIDSSFIMTFDAYALFLVKKYHSLLNLDKDIGIIDVNILNNEKEKVLDAIMEEMYANQDESFLKLIDTFCVKDDQAVRDAVFKITEKIDAISDKKEYYDRFEERFYSDEAIDGYIKRFEELLLNKIASIAKMIEEFSYGVENVSEYFLNIDALTHTRTLKQINEALAVCEMSKKRLPKGSEVSDVKKKINEAIKELKAIAGKDEGQIKEEVLSTKENDLCLLSLCKKLDEGLLEFKRKKGLYTFSDIFHMAISLAKENPEIAREISEGFDEILIDEYQDTNDLQDDFISLIERNNVYMVGDVKQSIYRFRNANPSLFMGKYADYSVNGKDELIQLPHNFRSRKEIIEDINVIFDRVMDLKIGGADYKDAHHMVNGRNDEAYEGQDPRLEVLTYEYDKSSYPFVEFNKHEAEAFITARDIRKKLGTFLVKDGDTIRPCEYKDFCIIIDRGSNFDLYKQIFTYFDIPCVIERDEKMSDSDLIYALKAVFTLLKKLHEQEIDPEFIFSYVSLARSFLVDMKDDVLYDIVKASSYKESDIVSKLQPIAERLDEISVSMALDRIIDAFDVYEKIHRIGDVRENYIKIDYLYQLASSLNESGYDVLSFNEYLDSLFDEEDKDITYGIDQGDQDAVKIINIHKSKGLQYKICYFPGLDVDFNLSDVNDRFLFSKAEGIITPVCVKGRGLKDSLRKKLFAHEYLKQDIGEKMRLLYVALTRAEEKMIMIAPLKDETQSGKIIDDSIRGDYRCFADLLDSIYADLDEKGFIRQLDLNDYQLSKDYRILKNKDIASLVDKNASKLTIERHERIVPTIVERSSFSKKASLIDADMIDRMELGTKLHYYLETLDFKDPDLSKIDRKHVRFIENFLASEIMKDRMKGKAYKEYEFIYEQEDEIKHGFIDLLMEYEDRFDIIDYKTKNIDDEHYDEQLNGYRAYIQSISDKKVNCYLYSIVDSTYREVK